MVQAVKLLPDRRVRQLSGHYADLGNRLKTPQKRIPPLSGEGIPITAPLHPRAQASARFARQRDILHFLQN